MYYCHHMSTLLNIASVINSTGNPHGLAPIMSPNDPLEWHLSTHLWGRLESHIEFMSQPNPGLCRWTETN